MNFLTRMVKKIKVTQICQKIHILVHGEKANLTDYKFIHF
jgi:hypothetical protein